MTDASPARSARTTRQQYRQTPDSVVHDADGRTYYVIDLVGVEAQRAMRAYLKNARLSQPLSRRIADGGDDVRCLLLTSVAMYHAEPRDVGRCSPGILVRVKEDVCLLHVMPRMRGKRIAHEMAAHMARIEPFGGRLFVTAPACLSGTAYKIWTAVGFIASTRVTGGRTVVAPQGAARRIPPGVDTLYLSFEKT